MARPPTSTTPPLRRGCGSSTGSISSTQSLARHATGPPKSSTCRPTSNGWPRRLVRREAARPWTVAGKHMHPTPCSASRCRHSWREPQVHRVRARPRRAAAFSGPAKALFRSSTSCPGLRNLTPAANGWTRASCQAFPTSRRISGASIADEAESNGDLLANSAGSADAAFADAAARASRARRC